MHQTQTKEIFKAGLFTLLLGSSTFLFHQTATANTPSIKYEASPKQTKEIPDSTQGTNPQRQNKKGTNKNERKPRTEDAPASFPGGLDSLSIWIATNLDYPLPDDDTTPLKEGYERVKFLINKEGKATDFSILQTLGPTFDSAAIKTLKKMPLWTPGIKKGKPVSTYFILPLRFMSKE